jgi:hypothetical protein
MHRSDSSGILSDTRHMHCESQCKRQHSASKGTHLPPSVRPAHASGGGALDATARAMALTAQLGARFGAGGLALRKPRLDAAPLVAASDIE